MIFLFNFKRNYLVERVLSLFLTPKFVHLASKNIRHSFEGITVLADTIFARETSVFGEPIKPGSRSFVSDARSVAPTVPPVLSSAAFFS